MAGSYSHVRNGGWSLIENMGDAAECVEELYFPVRSYLSDEEIEQALDQFHRFARGEDDPSQVQERSPESEIEAGPSDFARAYLETQSKLNS